MLRLLLFASALLASGCIETGQQRLEEFGTRLVTLPDGAPIRVEVMTNQKDIMRGMMFRDSLPADRGMLFVYAKLGLYPYWAYQVRMPLDIVWLDNSRRIVEIVTEAPPCKTVASQCPRYGGTQMAIVILELLGGSVRKHGLQVGQTLVY
jgi:uncharacterized membrane protein (UPF0127 family)